MAIGISPNQQDSTGNLVGHVTLVLKALDSNYILVESHTLLGWPVRITIFPMAYKHDCVTK